ncbi:MAG: YopX family protein [Enterococcus faecalis]|nr:YopX family protein [Enterococcus faecalis]MDU3437609.1 YopX family protein [Enterococcus faecalis]MDU3446838.1 YopX family protein [Enterococcus faecalis]
MDVSNTFDGTSSLEILGNIHENPELLEVAE